MSLPTYLVINSLVFSFAVFWAYRRAEKFHLKPVDVLDLSLVVMFGAFVGARLFHVLFEHPEFYALNTSYILRFWLGGFVFYGGMIGSLIAAWVFCRFKKLDFWRAADLGAPVFALSYGIGRLGCFAAGCCYGKPTALPWGVRFPEGGEAPFGVAVHPTQLYATLFELGTLACLLWFERSGGRTKPKVGQVFGLWLVMHGVGRLMMEHFRDDFRGPRFLDLSVSTWISFAVMVGGVWILKLRKRTA